MRFKIGETTYDGAALDQLSLVDILSLEKGSAELGHVLKWSQVQDWVNELDRIVQVAADETRTKAVRDAAMREHQDHPGVMWVMALMIWASRRLAGEVLSFEQAISFPMRDLEWLTDPEPQNRAERRADPTKARPQPKGSGRAVKPRPVRTTKT